MSTSKGKGPTDFNDLHNLQGLDAVREQVLAALDKAKQEPVQPDEAIPPEYDQSYFEQGDDFDLVPSNNSHYLASGGAKTKGISKPTLDELFEYYYYIYGTDTYWDVRERRIFRLSSISALVGRRDYKIWNDSDNRYIFKNVVFDPSNKYNSDHYVNLYDGLEVKKRESVVYDDCAPILEHIFWMCNEDKDVYLWLLKWIAYPLQNPGAKMQTSIINYGLEGTGKSFLWETIIKKMYGRYGITVGQAQLESSFTTWKSHKLFVVAEEVVNRSEKAHYKGQLKHMVTGDSHIINEKGLPEREEDNLMNFVFLSNNTQPLDLDYGDRRYLVLYMGKVMAAQYYKKLGEWVENEGIETFYSWLMSFDLTGFSPHEKPPMTEAKSDLIAMSMPSPVYFYQQWSSGELGLPIGPCANEDLFNAYRRWCDKANEYHLKQRHFSGEMKRMLEQKRFDICFPEVGSKRKTVRIWLPQSWAEANPNASVEQIRNACAAFRVDFVAWSRGKTAC